VAGAAADRLGMSSAIHLVAGMTLASGIVVAAIYREARAPERG
jgi:hypothetical protein